MTCQYSSPPVCIELRWLLVLLCWCETNALAEYRISDTTPADRARSVSLGTAIQAHVSARFDPGTVNHDSVRLFQGENRVPARVTSDLGGIVTISPEAPLPPETEYRIEITSALESAAGEALEPFFSTFRTGRAADPASRSLPPSRKTKISATQGLTSLALGPDGALYAATSLMRWLTWLRQLSHLINAKSPLLRSYRSYS